MEPPDDISNPKRLEELARYAILDTPAEADFDEIVELVAELCGAPIALVSLVAEDRQWFKARVGFEPSGSHICSSVCAFVLVESDILVIPDLTEDPRTRGNPLVTDEPHMRFYAGAPLRSPSGEVLGSLCAIDTVPRPAGLTDAQAASLKILARHVMVQFDLRRAVRDRDALLATQNRAEGHHNGLLDLGDRLRDLDTVGEMTRAASAIVGETLGVARVGFGRIEDDGTVLVVEPDWAAEGMTSVAGPHRFEDDRSLATADLLRGETLVVEDVLSDPRTMADPGPHRDLDIRALVNVPVRDRGRIVAVFLVHDRKPRIWTPEVLAFLRNVADRLEVGVARLAAEAQQKILNQELSHRMKNSFAMVQAIASQTLKTVPDREPVEAFTRRLHTLSSAHDLLLQQSWASARLDGVVRAVLGALVDPTRFALAGPAIELGPRATLSISLLLHELATNASKYGGLSAEGGGLAITWWRVGEDDSAQLALSWRETGGPAAASPKRKGFGSRLIRAGLIGTGGVDLRYLPSGFEADFTASLSELQLS